MHSTDNELGKKYMGATGGIRTWLSEGKIAKREEWLEPEVSTCKIILDAEPKTY